MNQDTQMRNIQDCYANMSHEAIMEDLESKRFNYSVLITNIELEINSCGILRSAEIYGCKEFFVYGRKRLNHRASAGANHYLTPQHVSDVSCFNWKDYIVVGFDNVEISEGLMDFEWEFDRPVLMCFGQEKGGIPSEIVEHCDYMVMIEQFGAIRCLGVNAAAAIAFYDYTSKLHRKEKR